jgi:hypothetical protein
MLKRGRDVWLHLAQDLCRFDHFSIKRHKILYNMQEFYKDIYSSQILAKESTRDLEHVSPHYRDFYIIRQCNDEYGKDLCIKGIYDEQILSEGDYIRIPRAYDLIYEISIEVPSYSKFFEEFMISDLAGIVDTYIWHNIRLDIGNFWMDELCTRKGKNITYFSLDCPLIVASIPYAEIRYSSPYPIKIKYIQYIPDFRSKIWEKDYIFGYKNCVIIYKGGTISLCKNHGNKIPPMHVIASVKMLNCSDPLKKIKNTELLYNHLPK